MHDQIRLNFERFPDFMVVTVICKNEEDLIKIEGARVFTTLYIDFSDAQGQLTLLSRVGSCQNSNSSKLLCMSSLSAKMKKIQSKMKELEFSQHFYHYKSMEIFSEDQGQLTPQSLDLSKFRTRSRCYGCSCYLQKSRRSNQK